MLAMDVVDTLRHRQDLVAWFARTRAALDAFKPDFVLMWGDDQYENFHEDVIPAFAVLAYEDMAVYPWTKGHKDRGIDKAGYPNFMRWFESPEFQPESWIFAGTNSRENANMSTS